MRSIDAKKVFNGVFGSSKKHSPGPWRIGTRHTDEGSGVLQLPICDNYGTIAWLTKRSETFGTDEANARLIVNAPELLAGLIQAVDQLKADYEPTALDGHGALIRKLETIIKKATF